MNGIRAAFMSCLLLGPALRAAPVAVTIATDARGPTSLKVGGTELLADGRPRVTRVVMRKADGSMHVVDAKSSQAWGGVRYDWAAATGRLDITVTVTNASKDTIHEIRLSPLSLRLAGKGVKLPRAQTNIGWPSVLPVRYAAGVLALCNEDVDRPLRLGFDRPLKGATPIAVHAGGDRMVYDELYMRRAIPPGKSDTYRLSLRFGPPGGDAHELADDVYKKFAARHPPLLNWPDRRPIVRLFLSGGLLAEQVLAYYRGGERTPPKLPADTKFGRQALEKLDRALAAAKQIDAQGIIIWDIEGDALPHPTTYIGDPRLTKVLNPRMDAVADAYFRKIRDAGLRCGVCIRPSHVVYAKKTGTMMQSFGAAKDPFRELDAKIRYCKRRWSCTLFYIDTNYFWRPRGEGGKWTPGMLAADVWKRLLSRHPKVLLVPEHNYPEYWAYTAVYRELDCGYRGIGASVRRVYPKAFCVAVVEDADPHKNHDLLVRMVRDGDSLMTFLYGLTRNASAIEHVYTEAKLLNQGEPKGLVRASVDELAARVGRGDLRGRFHAARRLASHPGAEAEEALIARVDDTKENWVVRKEAIVSLGKLKAPRAIEAIGRRLDDRKADLKYFAMRAIKAISKVVTPDGLDDLPGAPPLPRP